MRSCARHNQQPTEKEWLARERVVAAFAGNPSGVVKMGGKMLDKPYLRVAEKMLALRGR
jgi:citrate lyase subunit beta / citryl-CoA lyase